MTSLTLLVPDKPDPERDAVCDAWRRAGGSVIRVARFWDPPEVDRLSVRVYGPDTFCLVLAEKLDLELVAPDDRLLATLPRGLLARDVHIASLDALTAGLARDTDVYVSEVVTFEAEARAFVLDGVVRACAIYEGAGDAENAGDFATEAARADGVPRTCVIDVGRLSTGSWAVVEYNATWGAGLNGCAAERIVDCLAAACEARQPVGV